VRRFPIVIAALLTISCAKKAAIPGDPPVPPDEPQPLHSEQGLHGKLVVEQETETNYFHKGKHVFKHEDGSPMVAQHYRHLRFLNGGILWGQQLAYLPGDKTGLKFRHILDDFQMILPGVTAWDEVVVTGVTHAYDPRQEPLSYYHRTGPVGAVFTELKNRNRGADAKAPVGVLGLNAGTQACYAVRGQKFTFYESDPALKRLLADSEKYFTHVADAKKRGAEVEVVVGDRRTKLKEHKDRKFALLMVEAHEGAKLAPGVLTKEAVQLYFSRTADDGIVAIHVSCRDVNLEPMFAKLADELKLAARIWADDGGQHSGKTASSWLVLAKTEKALGTLASSAKDLGRDPEDYFRPLVSVAGVPAWTDEKAEVVPGMKLPRR
jgi:hypothetical protein